MKARNAELERSVLIGTVARKHELPDAIAARLQGETAKELDADAKALQALLVPAAPSALGGGLNSSDEGDGDMDPANSPAAQAVSD